MFLPHGYFSFWCLFHIVFLKMAAWAVLHFNITCQMTSIGPGTQTVLHNRATPGICSCALHKSTFRKRICPDSNCRGFAGTHSLADCNFPGTFVFSGDYHTALAVMRFCRTVPFLWAGNFGGLTILRTVFCQGLTVLRTVNYQETLNCRATHKETLNCHIYS